MNAIEYAQRANELYAVPDTANQLRVLFKDDSATMKDIANVVSCDPGLAVHLLKYANSAVYRFERKIESLDKAIQVMGLKAVYEFALVFGISNMIQTEHAKYIDISRFWQQSILCALYGVFFAKKCKKKDTSRLYTSGLLHNVGELAVLRVSPTLARDCNRFSSDILPKYCQEEVLGFSYAEISAALLQRWMIPDSLVSTIAMQHHDDSPAVTVEAQIIQLSYMLAIMQTYPDYYDAEEHLPEFLYTSLGLSLEDCSNAIESSHEQYLSLSAIFKMN